MRFGLTMFATDLSMPVVDLGRAAEERGFDSLWLPEHTHIPTSRRTPWPVDPARELPEQYKRSLDPFVALTAVAAATTTLRLGTGILLAAQRDPVVTAKAAASVDHLSGGRLAVGVGFGWNVEEMADHGVDYGTRRAKAREHMLAMRRLWEDDIASFDGDHVSLPASWSWPKPQQRPLPVLLGGGAGPKLFDHIAEYGQGWIPIGGSGLTTAVPRLRERMEAAGRDPMDLEIVPSAAVPDAGKLEHFARVGVTECVFDLPSAPADVVLPIIDRYAELIRATG